MALFVIVRGDASNFALGSILSLSSCFPALVLMLAFRKCGSLLDMKASSYFKARAASLSSAKLLRLLLSEISSSSGATLTSLMGDYPTILPLNFSFFWSSSDDRLTTLSSACFR